MEKISKYKELALDSLGAMGAELGKAIPNIIGALMVLILGWLFTKFILYVIRKALKISKIDSLNSKINDIDLFGDKKLNLDITKLILGFVKWTMIIILIIIASDIMNLKIISEEITSLLAYLPKLISALVIFTLGLLLANFVKKSIQSFFESLELSGSKIISQIVFIILIVFISITALNQAGVDTEIITSNITMILAAFLLAFALALGLGAQSVTGDLLRTFYARKTYEVGQKIQYGELQAEVVAIDNISMTLKTKEGRLVVPIKNIVESEIKIQDEPLKD